MSGGHWNYSSYLENLQEDLKRISYALEFLEVAEYELDWGHCNDTCLDCARKRVVAGLEVLFDNDCYGCQNAVAVARDSRQNLCEACAEREIERARATKRA